MKNEEEAVAVVDNTEGQDGATESKKQKTEDIQAKAENGYEPPKYTDSWIFYYTPWNKPSQAQLKAHKEAFEAAERAKLAQEAAPQEPRTDIISQGLADAATQEVDQSSNEAIQQEVPPQVVPTTSSSSSSSDASMTPEAEAVFAATSPAPICVLHTPKASPKGSPRTLSPRTDPQESMDLDLLPNTGHSNTEGAASPRSLGF